MQRTRRSRPYPTLTRAQRCRRREHRRRRTLREAARAEQATPARPHDLWTATCEYVNHPIDVRQPAMVAALNRLARAKLPARREAIRRSPPHGFDASIRVTDQCSAFTVLLPPCPICHTVVSSAESPAHDRVPRPLPCGHTVCAACCRGIRVHQLPNAWTSEQVAPATWPCPFCRRRVSTDPDALPTRPRGLNFLYYGYSYTVPLLEAFYCRGTEPPPAVVERLYRYLEAQWEADPAAFEAALNVVETEVPVLVTQGTYECTVRLS